MQLFYLSQVVTPHEYQTAMIFQLLRIYLWKQQTSYRSCSNQNNIVQTVYTSLVMVDLDKNRLVEVPPSGRQPPDEGLTRIYSLRKWVGHIMPKGQLGQGTLGCR